MATRSSLPETSSWMINRSGDDSLKAYNETNDGLHKDKPYYAGVSILYKIQ